MAMKCKCSRIMKLELRTVKYTHHVAIRHVPVLVCEKCSYYTLTPAMKPVLKQYIDRMGPKPSRGSFSLTEYHELASLIYDIILHTDYSFPDVDFLVEQAIKDRINDLLDLYRYAGSVGDDEWVRCIRVRLSQLSEILPELSRH